MRATVRRALTASSSSAERTSLRRRLWAASLCGLAAVLVPRADGPAVAVALFALLTAAGVPGWLTLARVDLTRPAVVSVRALVTLGALGLWLHALGTLLTEVTRTPPATSSVTQLGIALLWVACGLTSLDAERTPAPTGLHDRPLPASARVVRDSVHHELSADEVAAGQLVRVMPHEVLPIDGVVVHGGSHVDLSAFGARVRARRCDVGAHVLAGARNGEGTLLLRAHGPVGTSVFARLRHPPDRAGGARVDRSALTVLAALALAELVLLLLHGLVPALAQSPLLLTALVGGSPAALCLVLPIARSHTLGVLAEHGVHVRDPRALGILASVSDLVLDLRTAVLHGRPGLTAVRPRGGWTVPDLVRTAASVAAHTTHAYAHVIAETAADKGLTLLEVTEYREESWRAARATVDGRDVRLLTRAAQDWPVLVGDALAPEAAELEAEGSSILWVVVDDTVAGIVAVGDVVRPEAPRAVSWLRRQGVSPWLVSSSAGPVVAAVAAEIGVTEVVADARPHERAGLVRRLRAHRGLVAVCGDGPGMVEAARGADVRVSLVREPDAVPSAGPDARPADGSAVGPLADVLVIDGELTGVAAARAVARRSRRLVLVGTVLAVLVDMGLAGLAQVLLPEPVAVLAAFAVTVVAAALVAGVVRLVRWPYAVGGSRHPGPAGRPGHPDVAAG